ncbi:NMDA receptor-regulated protein 1-domain-containing protein [Crepidotus variabilis]|uniref:NMDA receptor-regulated protein 1-domain-containing protein n=1 Tax=Crepidotus variabilis TaxID=179855 RepID=A0A9P6JNU9_9AGAR|nr:NMDA receptor-regulated protein 1-domain-containing protein [Crepidotus variabilis]
MSKLALQKKPLPSKEAGLFKELLTLYETRQLKKGLKTADQILKKFPEHGETLCMKGLVLTNMGRREEGIDLVKKGIKFDLMSHICWHVFGLIQKADKNYEEALKSYTQALRFDKENMNLLRDSASLQTQLRLFESLVEIRHTILRLRPNQRQNWIGLAVAHHLNGNLEEAKKVLEHYFYSLKNIPDYDVEHSEVLLYYISILEGLGELSLALTELDQSARSRTILDRMAILETRARILTKQNVSEADEAWQSLIERNPDNYESYRGYLTSQGITLDTPNPEAVAKLEEFVTKIPRATAPLRLLLNVSSGDKFKELIGAYITKRLEKGIPSLFADIKSLYVDEEKRKVVEDIADGLREKCALEITVSSEKDEDPSTHLWTLYFLAQHYSYLKQHTKALTILDFALHHTPTLPELLLLKGRILKRLGDFIGAAKYIHDARLLDGQDRFLNTKCGKYLLRAGMIEEASRIFGMFTKKDAPSPASDLQDMQSLLFMLEEADAHRRDGKLNMALKRYMAVKSTFDDFDNDQYDFHGYNLRKFTINIYLTLLKWEDRIRSHPGYVKAAIEASRIFVLVHDDPSAVSALQSTDNLTEAEKKAKKKAKKAEKKKVEEDKKAAPQPNDKDPDEQPKKDEDPDGFKLLGSSDPLEQAAKLLQPLQTLVPESTDGWIAIYDVAIRRKKLLQAIAALNRVHSLDPTHPELHIRLVDIKQRSESLAPSLSTQAASVFSETLTQLVPEGLSLETLNSQYLQKHGSDGKALLAVAKAMNILNAPQEELDSTVFGIVAEGVKVDVKTALSTVHFLATIKSQRVTEFKEACQKRFQQSTAFSSPTEIAELKKTVIRDSTIELTNGVTNEEVKAELL